MSNKPSNLYHLFILLSIINWLTFYVFAGQPVLDIHQKGIFDDILLNYFLSISVILFAIWATYHIARKRIFSGRLIWLHLAKVCIIVFIIPWIIIIGQAPMPRRYFDLGDGFSLFRYFGSMTGTFTIILSLLLASEVFLLLNLRSKRKIVQYNGNR